MPNFTVINGGSGGGTERAFREHKYASALWDAIYPQSAASYTEIRDRMSATLGEQLAVHDVNNTIYTVRKHSDNYGWTIPHAQKGRVGGMRRYFPVMLDGNSPALRTDTAKKCFRDGAVSSCLTIATMAENEAVAIDAAADSTGMTADQKRRFRAAAGMFTAAAEMARRVLNSLPTV